MIRKAHYIWQEVTVMHLGIISGPLCQFGIDDQGERRIATREMFDRLKDTLLRNRELIHMCSRQWMAMDVAWIVAGYTVEIEAVHFT